jgi:hypothetical protein
LGLVADGALICLVAITALGLRLRRRLTLLALPGRLIAITLVTLLGLTLLALPGGGLTLLALSGGLIPIALILLSLALFPPFLAGSAALLIRLAPLLPRSILRALLALLSLTLLALIRRSLARCLISLSLALGALMLLSAWLSFLLARLAGLIPLRLPMILRGSLRVVVLGARGQAVLR